MQHTPSCINPPPQSAHIYNIYPDKQTTLYENAIQNACSIRPQHGLRHCRTGLCCSTRTGRRTHDTRAPQPPAQLPGAHTLLQHRSQHPLHRELRCRMGEGHPARTGRIRSRRTELLRLRTHRQRPLHQRRSGHKAGDDRHTEPRRTGGGSTERHPHRTQVGHSKQLPERRRH